MEGIGKWVRTKLIKWLGISTLQSEVNELQRLTRDLVSIGVDVHFKEPHMILIYSKLNGGQIRHIDANFSNMRELKDFVEELRYRFHTTRTTFDCPPQLKDFFGRY